ncbi:MAG: MFS transporter [Alphaproteobacteria bacterium]|nr:MFS transporter [Alphaproteobacteria bacterium]
MTSDPQAPLHVPFEIAPQRPSSNNARVWYLAGMCPYFGAIGVQNVVFMWLMTQILHASPAQVGLAQMLTMLPMLTVILLGGVVADRRELRRHLIFLQVIMALLPLSLALCIGVGQLSYWGLVSVSVAIGVVGAFIVPARDAMLSRVEDGEMQRTVTAMTGLQFASQIAGLPLGGSASWLALRFGAGPGDPLGAAGLLSVQGHWCSSPHGALANYLRPARMDHPEAGRLPPSQPVLARPCGMQPSALSCC